MTLRSCGVLAIAALLLLGACADPSQDELSDLFDQSVVAVSSVLGDPMGDSHEEGWHESNPGGVNCRMRRQAQWELGGSDANTAIESFEEIVNSYGERHGMAVQPVLDDPVLNGEPRTYFIVYDGYKMWMWGGSYDEGVFSIGVDGADC